jgi:hypothetical protein
LHHVHNDWVYFKIRKGIYGLPQSGILAQKLLTERLAKKGYYQCECTPGLWRHKWCPIVFTLIVDDFGVEYVGEEHAIHLRDTIKEHYDITENWNGDLYSGINLGWNYTVCTCRLSMEDYVDTVLTKYNHQRPKKPILSPYKAVPISYGAKVQYTDDEDTTSPLNDAGVKRVQGIVGALLYYAGAVDNKLLHALSEIGTQQAAATEATNKRVNHLLDYCSTYPNDGVLYCTSDMILAAHSNAAHLNISKARSRAGAHIMLSEDIPVPTFNGPVLTISQIIKFVASSAAELNLLVSTSVPKNGPSTQLPCGNGMTAAKISHSNRQHYSIRRSKQNHHNKENEIHGHAPVMAALSQVPGPVPLLLGTWTHQPCRLPYQSSSGHLPRVQKTHTRRLILFHFPVLHQNFYTHSAHCKGVLRDSIFTRDSHLLSHARLPLISPASEARSLPHSQSL